MNSETVDDSAGPAGSRQRDGKMARRYMRLELGDDPESITNLIKRLGFFFDCVQFNAPRTGAFHFVPIASG